MRPRYFKAVEGMRGIAALLVLGGHVLWVTSAAGGASWRLGAWIASLGVCVFFTLSGFLLYRPFVVARDGGPSTTAMTPSYLWRRMVRIFPAYWAALTVLAIWPGLHDVFTDRWWAAYSLLHVYVPDAGSLGVAWTLSVELSFYLVLPVVAWLLQTRGVGSPRRRAWTWELAVLGGLAILSLAVRAFVYSGVGPSSLGTTLLGTFSWFALGMLLAVVHSAPGPRLRGVRAGLARPAVLWAVAASLFVTVVCRPGQELARAPLTTLFETAALGLCAACIVAPAAFGDGRRAVRAVLANRTIVFVGLVSYGIYLWHAPIGLWLARSDLVSASAHPTVLLLALLLPVSLLLGAASWYGVERPLMRRAGSVKALARSGPRVASPVEMALKRVAPVAAKEGGK